MTDQKHSRAFLLLLVALAMLGPLTLNILVPSLPGLPKALGTSKESAQLTFSLYLFGMALSQLVLGPMADRFGRRPVVLAALVVYVASSLVAFIAPSIEVLIVGVLLFRMPINGDISLLLALTGLFMVTTLGIGLLISTVANTQQEAMLTTMFTILPSIFLSGFFFPLAAMPAWLQVLSYAIPLRYFLIIARGIVIKGVGLSAIWPEVVALIIFAVVVMGAAATRFKKSLD